MKLNDLLKGIAVITATGDLEREIGFLTFDSRTCREGVRVAYAVLGFVLLPFSSAVQYSNS